MPAQCEVHPDIVSVDSCRRCSAKLCAACRNLDGLTPYCAACYRLVRRAPVIRGAVIFALVGGLAGGGFYFYQTIKPPFDYGRSTVNVRKYEADLAREPCDKPAVRNLVGTMLGAGNSRGSLEKIAAFEKTCGAMLELKNYSYVAHVRLGEHDLAIADLDALVDAEPNDSNHYGWRGTVYRDKGDDKAAMRDYEKALSISPDLVDVSQSLATLYQKNGRPCDALAPLDHLVQRYGDAPWIGNIQVRIDTLTKEGHCDRVTAAVDHVSIATPPGKRDIRVKVKINSVEAGTFIVDTGATVVAITTATAMNSGIDLRGGRKTKIETANGQREGTFVIARSVDVQGLVAERVQVVVVDDLGPGIEGLLGMSYLSHFDIRKEGGAFEIRTRTKP